ncbi:MAG: hypothetical protein ACE5OZ_01925 [Candidatus Heimdallarchaeota archaeon]
MPIDFDLPLDFELLDQHYHVPPQYLLVETDLYRIQLQDQAVAIPTRSRDERWQGFVIFGLVKIAADALVHSPKGAVGRGIERECKEVMIFGISLPDDWKTIPKDIQKAQHRLRATELLDELSRKHLHVRKHCDDDSWTRAHHLIVAPQSLSDKHLWIIGSKRNEMVVIDGSEVLVRKNGNLVYLSGPNGLVEITGEGKTLSIGGPGGITFNCKGEDVTLGTFLNNLFNELGDSFRSHSRHF